ncbi:MAG: hypothetical protein LKK00_07995 [Intestinimonas sp.]|jgi:lactate dehydrogenase-like 2-hydroxyacid dehydrogenase|nr:hypothetical protein [Intestinimonas sp.]
MVKTVFLEPLGILTAAPHIGSASAEVVEKRAVLIHENLSVWLAGKPRNVV